MHKEELVPLDLDFSVALISKGLSIFILLLFFISLYI
jgi:hypothetical protein